MNKDKLSKIFLNPEKISKADINKEILRAGLSSELDTINLYEQMTALTANEDTKKALLDIIREEKGHVGRLQAILLREDKEQERQIEEGKKEVVAKPPDQKAAEKLPEEQKAVRPTEKPSEPEKPSAIPPSTEKPTAIPSPEVKETAKVGFDLEASEINSCTQCGHKVKGKAPDRCPVCGAPGERFRRY